MRDHPEDEMILRRRLKVDGKSTASINDVPVSIGLLRGLVILIEIQGQFEGRGLLDASTHGRSRSRRRPL